MVDGLLQVTFVEEKANAMLQLKRTLMAKISHNLHKMMQIQIPINLLFQLHVKVQPGIAPEYDYTQLGETWSTPRIVRIPDVSTTGSVASGGINTDKYVAIMGGGMSKNDLGAGSVVFLGI